MSRRAFRIVELVLPVVAALVSACGTPTEPTVTAPPSATAGLVAVTETFNGTLVFGGIDVHTFHTMQGPVTVTLDSLDPADAPAIAVAIGMWDGLSCQLVLQATLAGPGCWHCPARRRSRPRSASRCGTRATLASDATLTYRVSAVHNEKPSS